MSEALSTTTRSEDSELARVQTELQASRALVARLTEQLEQSELHRERIRVAYMNAIEQLELMRRRLFVAKAERFDTPEE